MLTGCVLAGVVTGVVCGCGAGGPRTITFGRSSWARAWPGPPASKEAVSRAMRIVARSPALDDATRGVGAALSGSFVWSDLDGGRIGVVLRFTLARAVDVDAVVPVAVTPPDAPSSGDCGHPYAPGWERLRAAGASRVFVSVDLVRNRVASVDTDAAQEVVSPVPGRRYPECTEVPSG